MQRLAIQNSFEMHGNALDIIDPDWYFILDTGIILRSIELFIYCQYEMDFFPNLYNISTKCTGKKKIQHV
jgi:hypothetical protein